MLEALPHERSSVLLAYLVGALAMLEALAHERSSGSRPGFVPWDGFLKELWRGGRTSEKTGR